VRAGRKLGAGLAFGKRSKPFGVLRLAQKSPGHRPGLLTLLTLVTLYATFFIAFETPVLIGSADSVATF
jgi:hypothetical protein